MNRFCQPLLCLCLAFLPLGASAEDKADCANDLDCKSSWLGLSKPERKQVFEYGDAYKAFMDAARTELSFVSTATILVEDQGFKRLTDRSPMQPGHKYYAVNRDRTIALIVVGREAPSKGFKVVGAHIDSPRLELKARPLYDKEGFALFQTTIHGGIKTYQWTNVPLALSGRVDKKDGTTVRIDIGMNEADPIFVVADMSPHTDRGFGDKPVKEQVKHEELDPIMGHIPDASGKEIAKQVLALLKAEYGISRADFVSAELALTPAYKSRDLGFDRGLVAAYGQDDRLGAYAALRAALALGTPERTAVVYLVDNEEVGNINNTGARSEYFSNLLARLLYAELGDDYSDLARRRALTASEMVSIDVNPGINPKNPTAFEETNAPRLGFGVNLKMYGQGFNANSEFTARIRAMLDENNIPWQTVTYKVGPRGGGTMGGEFSRLNMEVIDLGVPVLSIHTPLSISSKVDGWNLYRACAAFLD
ncbi:MAG: aminopeptidase 1 [Gammaproteobacteria bacterium]|nr:aminopeptidase 1 [Gammaproteobacteria bacterium]